MTDSIIEVRHLGKCYRLGEFNAGSLREEMANLTKRFRRRSDSDTSPTTAKPESFWALRDVTFEVAAGQVVGVIGKNGAGKSTLFKLLSRITEPSTGEAFLRGRVASLLEVGTGFHPELTGRDNIFLSGTIMGMTRSEIQDHFDEIVGFAGVESYLDTPVKRYSSGMYVRLGFAIAAHLTCEILIIDEVLAVGDAEFQQKCLGKMKEVANQGRTVLFVSHNMPSVQNLCDRAIWLSGGQLILDGTPTEVITRYLTSTKTRQSVPLKERTDRSGSQEARITAVRISSDVDTDEGVRPTGEVTFELDYSAECEVVDPVFAIGIYDGRLAKVIHLSSSVDSKPLKKLVGSGKFVCRVPGLPLHGGEYTINVSLHGGKQMVDRVEQAAAFTLIDADFFGTGRRIDPEHGMILIQQDWTVIAEQEVPT
jgi:lipopolysaccharide transport system ATP-binding protein